MTLLEGAGPADVAGTPGLVPPLAAEPRTFAQVYGADDGFLATQSAEATLRGEPGMAGLLSALDAALRDRTLEIAVPPKGGARLAPYVYPVV